jgi:hypothetical protein
VLPSAHCTTTRSYQPLAGGYQELPNGGLVYQATTTTEAIERYLTIWFFPDVLFPFLLCIFFFATWSYLSGLYALHIHDTPQLSIYSFFFAPMSTIFALAGFGVVKCVLLLGKSFSAAEKCRRSWLHTTSTNFVWLKRTR